MGVRQDRLGDQIRDLVAGCFIGEKMGDPRLEGVTITHVKMGKDLMTATTYYRVYDPSRAEIAKAGLESSKGHFKKILSQYLKVRKVPDFAFVYDTSVDTGAKIEELLSKLRQNSST